MKAGDALRSIIFSWDFFVSFIAAIILYLIIPTKIPQETAKEIFAVSITVLAIIFSVFFAALAVLITSGDNEFVRFLMEDNSYNKIIWTFRVSLLLLFLALMVSILLFVAGLSYDSNLSERFYPNWIMLVFSFLSLYALLSSVNSSLDAIKYAQYRARFLEITKDNKR